MKTLLIIILLTNLFYGCGENHSKNTSQILPEKVNVDHYKKQRNLFGKVKTLEVQRYKVVNKFGNISEGEMLENYYIKINNKGERIEYRTFSSDGKLEKKYLSKYNSQGKKIELIGLDKNNNTISKQEFKYNDTNMVEQNKYNSVGNLEYKIIYKYDKSGNKIEKSIFRSGNWYKSTYKYNGKGELIYKNEFDVLINKKGYFERHESFYKYDNKNRKYEEYYYYTKDGMLLERERKIYDNMGNLIEEKSYWPNKMLNKRVYKYNSEHNLILEKTFNPDGSTYGLEKYQYDDWGNLLSREIHVPWNGHEWSNLIEYKYEYDNFNNWVKRTFLNNKIPKEITIRKISYYQ